MLIKLKNFDNFALKSRCTNWLPLKVFLYCAAAPLFRFFFPNYNGTKEQ